MNEDNKSNAGNSANTEEGTKWIVAMLSRTDALFASSNTSAGTVLGEIVTLKDPSTGDRRDYAMMKTCNSTEAQPETHIVEFQDIPKDFSSFMVGRHIVKDGSLYMLNRVDPLFFFLAAQEHHLEKQQSTKSWQPYEQCLEEVSNNTKGKMLFPKEIHSTISVDQLQHLCLTFENDDVLYFRFDVNKALKFLKRKQERVLECLIRQDQTEQRRKDELYESSFTQYNSGSASRNEHSTSTPSKSNLADVNDDKELSNGSNSPAVVISDTKALELQSIQIVCNYLSDAWSEKFVEYVGVTMDQVQDKVKKAPGNRDTAAPSTTTVANGYSIQRVVETENAEATKAAKVAADKKAMESYRTPGNKRLAKVNTKGMKSIASFFGGPPKSKKPKHS
jgi:hypothetical protein